MLIRLMYMLCWVVIGFPTLLVACYQKRERLWDWAYYFDNDEDGFDGSKLGWYDKYLKKDIGSLHWFNRALVSYKWSAWRNPCFNLRKHPKVSVDVQHPENIKLEGNTFFHSLDWMEDKETRNTRWYKLKASYEGKVRTSWFFLIPIFKTKWLYIRFGLKVYPRHYFDDYWINRIKEEGFPKDKRRGISALSLRVR